MALLIIFMIFGAANALVDDGYLGCYEDRPDAHLLKNRKSSTVSECKGICQRNFYRYYRSSCNVTIRTSWKEDILKDCRLNHFIDQTDTVYDVTF